MNKKQTLWDQGERRKLEEVESQEPLIRAVDAHHTYIQCASTSLYIYCNDPEKRLDIQVSGLGQNGTNRGPRGGTWRASRDGHCLSHVAGMAGGTV